MTEPDRITAKTNEVNLTFGNDGRAVVTSPVSGPLTSGERNQMSMLDKVAYYSRGWAALAGVPLFGVFLAIKARSLAEATDTVFLWIFDHTDLPTELVVWTVFLSTMALAVGLAIGHLQWAARSRPWRVAAERWRIEQVGKQAAQHEALLAQERLQEQARVESAADGQPRLKTRVLLQLLRTRRPPGRRLQNSS